MKRTIIIIINLTLAINGGWRAWSKWEGCSKTCGGGTEQRVRRCDSPAPAHGGQDCVGENKETRMCATDTCPRKLGYFVLYKSLDSTPVILHLKNSSISN